MPEETPKVPEFTLLEKFKQHIHFEEGMDATMLPFYLENAKRYVKRATDTEAEHLVLLVAGIMYEYRIAEDKLKKALDAITPFIIQEAMYSGADQ